MRKEEMNFDQILEEIGEFGRYQKTNYLLICLPVMFAAANSLSYVFTAGVPSYRCLVPECEDPLKIQLFPTWLVNATPGTENWGKFIPEKCYRYEYEVNDSIALPGTCPRENFNQKHKLRCNAWIYDSKERTIVQEWELTCAENAWKLALVGTIHFAGLVVGTALSGFFADKYGRKIIFVICIVFMAITGILQGLSWDYYSFLVFAFLNAVGTSGVYPLAFIIGVEMVGPKYREMSSIILNYFYAIGEAFVGLAAWLLHDWQLLQFALSVPPLLFIFYYWTVPESIRWLIARDKHEKAEEIIREAAKVNKKELSSGLLSTFQQNLKDNSDPRPGDPNGYTRKSEIYKAVKEVFRSTTLCTRYAMLLYIWAANATVYYGLSLNSTNLSGNKYFNFTLVCLIEIPGYTLAWVALNKFGRKWSLSASMILCAVTCAAGAYVAQDLNIEWAAVTLFLIGKLGITSSFAVIYTYTAEMMPTVIRSGGVGCMSTFARFGAMLAPFIPLLEVYFKTLPMLIFGALSFSAGLLGLFLPETFRKRLPDTVKEAEQIGSELKLEETDDDH